MATALRKHGHTVTETDITTGHDFLLQHSLPNPSIDGIVTNPPFSLSVQFALHALGLSQFVALLQPVYNLGGIARYQKLWNVHKPTKIIVISDRMKFEHEESHFNHMWCVWDKTQTTDTTIEWSRT